MKMHARYGPNNGRFRPWMIPFAFACLVLALGLMAIPNAHAAVPLDTAPDIVAYTDTSPAPATINAAALKTTIAQEASTALVPCDVGLAITANTSAGYNTDVGALTAMESEGSASAATIVGDMLNLANIAIYFDTSPAALNDAGNAGVILANTATAPNDVGSTNAANTMATSGNDPGGAHSATEVAHSGASGTSPLATVVC